MKRNLYCLAGIICGLSLSGCSSKQMYMAGQDLKCQKQEKQDIYNQQDCKPGDYDTYQKQLAELEAQKRKDTNPQ
ncbi:MAG: hypothetical protein ACFHVJ_10090 [Aestuariibacter sp.]